MYYSAETELYSVGTIQSDPESTKGRLFYGREGGGEKKERN